MAGEGSDLLRDAVALIVRELMEAEVAQLTGAGRGERAESRVTQLNGYRQRMWETRVGEVDLAIPRTRSGPSYWPSFLEPRRRCEQAIVAVVMEAYVNGVSTRKVDRLVEQLGIQGMSKDRVSRLCRELDEHVEQFRQRPLEGAHPYLWLDAKHVKVRDLAAWFPKPWSWPTPSRRPAPRGDRPRYRRGRERGVLDGVPSRPQGPRPARPSPRRL